MPALTPPEQIVKGYKATDKNMRCRGYQFELGVWHKHEGDVIYCDKGFHFCTHQSGPWCYYIAPGTRIWEVEAREVELHAEPGAAEKHVARYIKFIREISVSGNWNTGDSNTGDSNTGHWNTGHRNTGHSNTGSGNAGDPSLEGQRI